PFSCRNLYLITFPTRRSSDLFTAISFSLIPVTFTTSSLPNIRTSIQSPISYSFSTPTYNARITSSVVKSFKGYSSPSQYSCSCMLILTMSSLFGTLILTLFKASSWNGVSFTFSPTFTRPLYFLRNRQLLHFPLLLNYLFPRN